MFEVTRSHLNSRRNCFLRTWLSYVLSSRGGAFAAGCSTRTWLLLSERYRRNRALPRAVQRARDDLSLRTCYAVSCSAYAAEAGAAHKRRTGMVGAAPQKSSAWGMPHRPFCPPRTGVEYIIAYRLRVGAPLR